MISAGGSGPVTFLRSYFPKSCDMKSRLVSGIASIVFLLLVGCGTADGSVKLAYIEDRPRDVSDLRLPSIESKLSENLSISMRLVAGEAEGGLILVRVKDDRTFTVQYDGKTANFFKLQVFRVANVLLEGNISVPDPLIPVAAGSMMEAGRTQLFYIKVAASSSASPGRFQRAIKFIDKNGGAEAVLKVVVDVLPIRLPDEFPVTIQAGIWPYKKWSDKSNNGNNETIKRMLELLSEYRFNGAAGISFAKGGSDKGLIAYCLDDLHFRRIRLPAKRMYSWKKPMSLEYAAGHLTEQDLEQEFKGYLSRFENITKNPRWEGRFSFKMWDEPRRKDYPDVVMSYRAAKKAEPGLKLELSEQPGSDLQNVADVWTPYLKFLRPSDVEQQHRLGKEVWIYANKVHGIDQPLYGMRILGWLIWKYNLDGYLFWGVNCWQGDPWNTVSSFKKDFFRSGAILYPDPKSDQVYPSLRIEAFREGIEDMLLLKELEKTASGKNPLARKAKDLVARLKNIYGISELYDNAPDPAKYRDEILDILARKSAVRSR